MFLEVYERIGKREEKHSFEASISDSNAALNHKDIYDWDVCYQSVRNSVWNASRCIAQTDDQARDRDKVYKLLALCWECVVCTTNQTKAFQRKYFQLGNHGKPLYTQCNLKISGVKINPVNLQNLRVWRSVSATPCGVLSLSCLYLSHTSESSNWKLKILLYSRVGGKRKQAWTPPSKDTKCLLQEQSVDRECNKIAMCWTRCFLCCLCLGLFSGISSCPCMLLLGGQKLTNLYRLVSAKYSLAMTILLLSF